MKTLKRTLVALAALTVASMSMTAVASAAETPSETPSESVSETPSESVSETPSETPSETSAVVTTAPASTTAAAATTKADKSKPGAKTVITIGTVTVKPGTTSASVPVTISGNTGFAATGFGFTYDPAIKFDSVEGGIIAEPEGADGTNYKALTSAKSTNITKDGVIYTLKFTIPADAKAGTVYEISGAVDTFADADGKDVDVNLVKGAIKVEAEKAATTVAATTAASTTKAAKKTAKKAGSSPATGEALPIAGAAAAVAVIGGVAIASRKRK